jgi:hypothetical protein
MLRCDWDSFQSTDKPAHLIAGIVPRTANAARLGRPARLNPSWSGFLEKLVMALKPKGQYALTHVPDATGTVVLCAFDETEDADRLAEVTGATDDPRGTEGAWAGPQWASRRYFLYDRHRKRQLVDYVRGIGRE